LIKDIVDEYARYRSIGEKAIQQVSDEALNSVLGIDNNSIAIIVRHLSGNLLSRFTDFLSSDGEKPWRDRDSEFQDAHYDRREVERMWNKGWGILESELSKLSDEQLQQHVYIRGQAWTIHDARPIARHTGIRNKPSYSKAFVSAHELWLRTTSTRCR